MVKLYSFNKEKGSWIFKGLAMKEHAEHYARHGYIVVYL
jgi:hypothetical protein